MPEPMTLAGRVVLVGLDQARSAELRVSLRERGLNPHVLDEGSTDRHPAIEAIDPVAVLAITVDRPGDDGRAYLERIKSAQPGLLVLAIAELHGASSQGTMPGLPADAVVDRDSDSDTIASHIAGLLRRHHYDPDVLRFIEQALPALLGSDWAVPLPAFVRSSAGLLAPTSALIEIGGPGLWGRLALSMHHEVARSHAERVLQRSARHHDEIWDVLGEQLNIFASMLRNHYAARGLDSSQSTPTVVVGEHVIVRNPSRMFSLVVPFDVPSTGNPLYVEWTLAHKGIERPREETKHRNLGGVTFL